MRIGLIYPNKYNKDKSIHLGLGYLVSYARLFHSDLDFTCLDTRVATKREKKEFLKNHFELVGITVSSLTIKESLDLINQIKTNNPDTLICVGGPYITMVKEDIFMTLNVNYAIYGEGEIPFSELISYLKGNKSISNIKGLIHRNHSVICNKPQPQIENLNSIPFPAYDIFKMDRYPLHRVITSRGCPYECSFCLDSKTWNGQWRKRDIENVIDELLFLFKNYKKKNVAFIDNSFDIDIKRVIDLCDKIVQKRIKFLWSANVRGENISSNVAMKLKLAGCYNVSTGIESSNNDILKRNGKKVTIEALSKGIANLRAHNIEVLGMFIIGNIGDTLNTVQESIEYAQNSNLNIVKFYSAIPYQGTPLRHEIEKSGGFINKNILEYDKIIPPVYFETPEFPYKDRVHAIKLAEKAGFF
jgi:radical SAM superfamily enzyme YgiQ (UPF0313 family)